MTATLLSMCQDVAGRLGLETLTSVASTTNQTARRLFRLATASGRSLSRRADWQQLRDEFSFTTVATAEQTGATLPTDWDRFVVETGYNRTRQRPVAGPLTPQEWQETQARSASLAPTDSVYMRGNEIFISPTPAAGQDIYFEYVSKNWCTNSTGTGQDRWQADTDLLLLDEEMSILDLMWRYNKSRGLPYAEDFRASELMIADRITKAGLGKRRMQLVKRGVRATRPMPPVISEGDWNQ